MSYTRILHQATRKGDMNQVRKLLEAAPALYKVNSVDNIGRTPLHWACAEGHLDMARMLVLDFKADIKSPDTSGKTPLYYACAEVHTAVVHMLISEFKADVNCTDSSGKTPLHWACAHGHLDTIRLLVSEFQADVNCADSMGRIPLHYAYTRGYLNTSKLLKMLVSDFKADVSCTDSTGLTPLQFACASGHTDNVRIFISEFGMDVNCTDSKGKSLLHFACANGDIKMVRDLTSKFKDNVNCKDSEGKTPLHYACLNGHMFVARILLTEFKADVSCTDGKGQTALYCACANEHLYMVDVLVSEFDADINCTDSSGSTLLHYACSEGHLDVAKTLLSNYKADANQADNGGKTSLHYACTKGRLDVAITLLLNYKANVNQADIFGNTPLHCACLKGHFDVAGMLIVAFEADVHCISTDGQTPLHYACKEGFFYVVKLLLPQSQNVNKTDSFGKTPFDYACSIRNLDVVKLLLPHFKVSSNGWTPMHIACASGYLEMVQMLLPDSGERIKLDADGRTPLMLAALGGHKSVAQLLLHDKCFLRDKAGNSTLHYACRGGNIDLVTTLIGVYRFDIHARNTKGDTPLHEAAFEGKHKVVLALHEKFGCDVTVKGHLGATLLHSACAGGNADTAKCIREYISPLVVDNNGNTPLHISAALGHNECVEALLQLNAPVLLRNRSGKTPADVASDHAKVLLKEYVRKNKDRIYLEYDAVIKHSNKKYSSAEHIIRVFVIGNPGAGKSSLIEALKREGLFDSFNRVSESSVPPHTAGIVPSIHTSKYCGRVLFYDFAGDAEYYSSHAAILESLASSKKGDNIFIIVVDLREEVGQIRGILNYWSAFIHHQKFGGKKPSLILVGSHADLMTETEAAMKAGVFEELQQNQAPCFILDCCKPKSRKIGEIQKYLVSLSSKSPLCQLSQEASILLGLLGKDFGNVTACSIKALRSHIEVTGIALPTDVQTLHLALEELHEIGLLFMVLGDKIREDLEIILNTSQLTNKVHQLLFSTEAKDVLRKSSSNEQGVSSSDIGIIPRNILLKVLPDYITKECLVQLQYCQEISHKDAHAFPSLTPSDSTDQSFLFFPALCSADKSDVAWVTPPDLSYGIGWLARCTDPCDYFPPRFLHVLLLRLVFRFTISVPPPSNQAMCGTSDHSYFQRRCTMWKTGVHWLTRQGVECMVELVNNSREVVILTNSVSDRAENCATVFNSIVSCVMEAKAEFCHSIRPGFFLLDSTKEADYLSPDNRFAMSDVEVALTCPEENDVIIGITGKKQMERSKLLCIYKFTHWYSLFPIDFASVLNYLKDIVKELYSLGLHLNIRLGVLNALEADFPTDVGRRRRELVKQWMSFSPNPPCWWHLVQALREVQNRVLAEEIREKYSVHVQLQEKLLDQQNCTIKPDVEFLESFASVVESKWPSLAASLSLSESEIEDVKEEGLSQKNHALKMLKKWVSREDATYGRLYQMLTTISLFQYGH